MEHFAETIRAIEEHLDALGAVASARRRGEELVAAAVDAHSAGLERVVSFAPDPAVLEADPELAEVLWVHRPSAPADDLVDGIAERIDSILGAIEQTGVPGMGEAAHGLLAVVGDLYGSALARALEILHEEGHGATIRLLLEDHLAAGALVIHGLHPDDSEERARRALAQITPTFAQPGPRVDFDRFDDAGVIRLRVTGEPKRDRWRVAVAAERAVRAAAPDATDVVVHGVDDEAEPPANEVFIPLSAIGKHREKPPHRWIEVPELVGLESGALVRINRDTLRLVACSVGDDLYVALDPFSGGELSLRVRPGAPPAVDSRSGVVFTFDRPLPVQRTGNVVEVALP